MADPTGHTSIVTQGMLDQVADALADNDPLIREIYDVMGSLDPEMVAWYTVAAYSAEFDTAVEGSLTRADGNISKEDMEWMAANGDSELKRWAAQSMLRSGGWAFWKTDEPLWRDVADFGKGVVVVAGASWLAGAACSTGVLCPIAVGAVAGGILNVAADATLDCFSDLCELPGLDSDSFWEAAEGVFLGGSGTALNVWGARLINHSRSTAGLITVFRSGETLRAGTLAVAETMLIPWGSRLMKIAVGGGFE